ncbi:class I SAM-dependent methyltransferase [Bacillus sp. Marseille-P3661]|uniref:class I SAM-dependent methyltransferase n=1 Tax=Bacillus sp. Marseille-P3661 TaxID=1936234 RepID=UPI000C81EAB2|nr:class I SAM-dependent methyltransferase [Bacillus sp. Marseille-P3661]
MQKDESIKDAVKQQFSKNAEKYVASESHAKGKDLPIIVDWLKPQPNWKALDIATGGGHVVKALAPYVQQVFSTDLTERMLQSAADHLNEHFNNVSYVIADAEALPFLANTFDVVTCRIAPHHFPNPERFISEVQRVLKPNGKFILIDNIVPNDSELANFMNTFEKLRDESHVRCLSVNEWQAHFTSSGLKEVKSELKKKTHDYQTWVKVTTKNEEQVESVNQYFLNAAEKLQQYYSVKVVNNEIQSITVDEWMVLCEKR